MAHEAVHTAMRGYSGVCVGSIHDYMAIVPMRLIAQGRRRVWTESNSKRDARTLPQVNVYSSIWQRCCESTGMPPPLTGQSKPKVLPVSHFTVPHHTTPHHTTPHHTTPHHTTPHHTTPHHTTPHHTTQASDVLKVRGNPEMFRKKKQKPKL